MTVLLGLTFFISLICSFLLGAIMGMGYVTKHHLIPLKKKHRVAEDLLKEATRLISKVIADQPSPKEGDGDILSPIQFKIK